MIELQDDEYEALITAINTYKETNQFYEAQISKLQEIIKRYEQEIEKLCNNGQKSLNIPPKSENNLSILSLDKNFKSSEK